MGRSAQILVWLGVIHSFAAKAAFTNSKHVRSKRFGVGKSSCNHPSFFATGNSQHNLGNERSSILVEGTLNKNSTNNQSPEMELGISILEHSMNNVEIVPDFRPSRTCLSQQIAGKSKEMSDNENETLFVRMLRGSASYIAAHRKNTIVLHVPAKLIDIHARDKGMSGSTKKTAKAEGNRSFERLLDDIALLWLLGLKIVIVIGCRGLLDEQIKAEQTEAPPINKGVRVTNETDLRAIKEIAGYARFEAERQLARALKRKGNDKKGGNVVSGNFFSAQPIGVRDGIDSMYTGRLRRVEKTKIHQAHANNDVVLLTSLGVSPSGEVFWVKSESLAAGVASSLAADKIIYLLEEPCHVREVGTENVIMSFRFSEAKRLCANFGVKVDSSTGEYIMSSKSSLPSVRHFLEKVGCSTNALLNGVKRAHLVCASDGSLLEELYTRDNGTGTMISRDLYDGIWTAKPEDVNGISELIQPLVDAGIIVDRPQAMIEKEIDTFYVFTRDDLLLACGQLKSYEGGYAEIGCLAVKNDYQKSGKGDAMLCKLMFQYLFLALCHVHTYNLSFILHRLLGAYCAEKRSYYIVRLEHANYAMVY
jgi:amino-acid N-acetyltransferase